MKILITGSTGFIGRYLLEKLKGEIYCFVRKTSNIKGLEKYNLITGDLMDKSSLLEATRNKDLVLHLATSHAATKIEDIIGSRNLIDSCKQNKVKKIIFLSSMAVKRRILDDYGKTKLSIEKMIIYSGIPYTILRPTIIYSRNNLSLIGKSLSYPFIVPIIGNGKYKLNPVYIEDLIKIIIECVNKKTSNKIYDIAGRESLSFNEIINISKKRFNIKKINIHIPISICLILFRIFPLTSIESIKGINQDTSADISSLVKDLKITPLSFREGIKNVHI